MKTAECVSPRHPDKMCDRISDSILDWCLSKDPNARVAMEVMGGHGEIKITGELSMKSPDVSLDASAELMADFAGAATKIAKEIGGEDMEVQINVRRQSSEIAQGVDTGGAGDQGIMIGYACKDNEAMIPQELYLARSLCEFIYGKYPFDGKTQITLDDSGTIVSTVASFQSVSKDDLRTTALEWLGGQKHEYTGRLYCNPAGDWNIGGFEADTGLTGRKLMVDNYGPQIPIGGGCFSGKDATKVDRSAAYMARNIAVHIIKEEDAQEVFVKLAYAIGVAEPVMAIAQVLDPKTHRAFMVDLLDNEVWREKLTPKAIIEFLDLRKPQFSATAEWGHFGNNFPWDK